METIARAKSGTKSPENFLDKAYSSAHAAVDSVAGAAQAATLTASDRVASVAHEAVDKAAGTVAPAADWLAAQGENLVTAKAYVSANPVKAVLIAAAAIFLISRVL